MAARTCLSIIGSLGLILAASSATQSSAFARKTYTYRTIGDVAIQADVYRADEKEIRPVVMWIHGGALVMGNRSSVPRQLLDLCKSEGYALVSIDYRLAPQARLPEIIGDLDAALQWVQGDGAKLCRLDRERMVVTGGSAGGYLTLMAGVLKPRLRGLVAYWGYGDVDGDWYVKPSEHYRKQPLVSKEDAYRGIGEKVLTGSEPGFDSKARGRYYLYLRQNGLWTREVTGFEAATEKARLDRCCPVRNITGTYPPTLLIHGTLDTDVPYELSANMAKELARHKVPHELITVPGAGHGLAGGERKLVDAAHERALAFVRERLGAN
jgi:acetyl esterase/lipase